MVSGEVGPKATPSVRFRVYVASPVRATSVPPDAPAPTGQTMLAAYLAGSASKAGPQPAQQNQ